VVGTLAVGVAAFLLAETVAAEAVLAAFVVTIVVTWAVEMLYHAGILAADTPAHLPPR